MLMYFWSVEKKYRKTTTQTEPITVTPKTVIPTLLFNLLQLPPPYPDVVQPSNWFSLSLVWIRALAGG